MATIGRADVAGTVPAIVAREIQKYTMPNLEFVRRVNHHEAEAKVGDRVQIPTYLTRPTPTQITTGLDGQAAEPDPQTATYPNQTISSVTVFVQFFFHVGIELSAYAEAVAQGDLTALFRQAGLDALAVQQDTTVANLAVGFTTNDRGVLGVGITDDLIRDAVSDLDGQNVPASPRAYIFHSLEKANYLGIDKYVSNLYRPQQPLTRGELGNLYGMDWAWSTQVHSPAAGQHNNLMFHPEAIGFVQRREPQVAIANVPDPGILQRIVAWSVWGTNETRDAFGVRMRGL